MCSTPLNSNIFRSVLTGAALFIGVVAISGGVRASDVAGVTKLPGGGTVLKSVQEGFTGRTLHFDAPPHAVWNRTGLADPMTIRVDSNYAAFIDQWRVSIVRAGQTDLSDPLFMAQGSGLDLPGSLEWSGKHKGPYRLRPGEELALVFEVRDVAGNVDRAEPLSLQTGRYLMKRQASQYQKMRRQRATRFDARSGIELETSDMPIFGSTVFLDISDWPAPARLGLAGFNRPAPKSGATERVEQIVPSGRYNIVVQRMERRKKGYRTVPVGTVPLDVAGGKQLIIPVPGSTEATADASEQTIIPDGLDLVGEIEGLAALKLSHTADSAEARLGVVLLDPEIPLPLLRKKKKRFLAQPLSAEQSLWGGPNAAQEALPPPETLETRSISASYPAVATDELILPHTDIQPGTLGVKIVADDLVLERLLARRHYIFDPVEGRLRMTTAATGPIEKALAQAKKTGTKPRLVAEYDILKFRGTNPQDTYLVEDQGRAFSVINGQPASDAGTGGAVSRLLSWFSGGE